MQSLSLDNIRDFNGQLLSLANAGLPLELGFQPHEPLPTTLAKIGQQLSVDVQRGLTIEQALATAPYLPQQYRWAFNDWLNGSATIAALDGPNSSAMAIRHVRNELVGSLVQPCVLLGISYLAFLYLCSTSIPYLEEIHRRALVPPGRALGWLILAREWMSVWGVLLPFGSIVFVVVLLLWIKRSGLRWLPGQKNYFSSIANANQAERLAGILEREVLAEQAIVADEEDASGSQLADDLATGIGERDATIAPIQSLAKRHDQPLEFTARPLLQWAMSANMKATSRISALRLAAGIYRQTAHQQLTRWRAWIPTLVGVTFGGVLVMAYALSLFLPVIELLHELTHPMRAGR